MKVKPAFRVLIVVLGCVATPGFSAVDAKQKTAEKAIFLVIYRPGPEWTEGKKLADLPLKEHFQYMIGLFSSGSLKSGGPLTDDSGGAIVLEASDEAEANAIAREDPAVKSGVFSYQLHPWRLVPWDKYIPAEDD